MYRNSEFVESASSSARLSTVSLACSVTEDVNDIAVGCRPHFRSEPGVVTAGVAATFARPRGMQEGSSTWTQPRPSIFFSIFTTPSAPNNIVYRQLLFKIIAWKLS